MTTTPAPAGRHAQMDRSQRYERHAERKLDSPSARPQPKVEAPREFRKVTLTEGLTVGDLADKARCQIEGHDQEIDGARRLCGNQSDAG